MTNYIKYLGIKHDYQNINCITLIEKIYKEELKCNVFQSLWTHLNLVEGKPLEGSRWKFKITLKKIEEWVNLNAIKVDLTKIEEYDVILFKSKKNRPIHFGMYTVNNNFIHVEEETSSRITALNQEWRDKIHFILRRKDLQNVV
mgnify:FL=1